MFKSTANADQHATRSASFSTRGSQRGLDLLNVGAGVDETLTVVQQRDALRARLAQLKGQLTSINAEINIASTLYKKRELNDKRSTVVAETLEVEKKLGTIKQADIARRSRQDLGYFLIEICRENMTKPQWAATLTEAQRRYDAQEK